MKIGLMLALGQDDGLERTLTWPELRDMALAAEDSGLDSVFAADHLVFHNDGRTEGIHECWTLLSAIAALTSRVEIGPLVLAVPFRNPALTAKMAAELDAVSGGRLILGLGCGWHEPEFADFDYPFDHRVGRFGEALQIILPLLREGRASMRGQWHRAQAELLPRGPREGGPPILIAGKGPRMLGLVAGHADAWNAAWYGPPDQATELDERIARLKDACEAQGRELSTLTLTAGVFVGFPHLLTPDREQPPPNAMQGTPAEVGAMLAGYRDHGIDHLIVHLWPRTPEAVAELGVAAAAARVKLAGTSPGARVDRAASRTDR
jgi:alkanesulfonate monooxygenase SsuD/methylene tetrahydromethanopterin reductase-like flavin-dependent oxidoreductase (luciferase family)